MAAELGVGDPHEWECASPVEPDTAAVIIQEFDCACSDYRHMYPLQLQVVEALAVFNRGLDEDFSAQPAKIVQACGDPNVKQLYHGTSAVAAKEIVTHSFVLPQRHGMFSKGIYFAGTPLKSWQYSTTGYMLVCDVALGRLDKPQRDCLWSAVVYDLHHRSNTPVKSIDGNHQVILDKSPILKASLQRF